MSSCDACANQVFHDHGKWPKLQTFGIVYPGEKYDEDPTDIWVEEIDIRSSKNADFALAREVARVGYQPGWIKIEQLPPGGSGGYVEIQSWP